MNLNEVFLKHGGMKQALAHSRPLKMSGHTSCISCIALIGQRGKLTGQMPKLARKCPRLTVPI